VSGSYETQIRRWKARRAELDQLRPFFRLIADAAHEKAFGRPAKAANRPAKVKVKTSRKERGRQGTLFPL